MLLHLNEADSDVVRACKAALRQAGPLLPPECAEINAMFQVSPVFLFKCRLSRVISVLRQSWLFFLLNLPSGNGFFLDFDRFGRVTCPTTVD